MQENGLFEYAVIRLVPKVEREEFFNVGVVLYCRGQRFLDMRYSLDENKLQAFCPSCDADELEAYLLAFQRTCHGSHDGGPIAKLPAAERFRWLTAKRSTVIQTSPVHPGLCTDAQTTLERLYRELVL
ncbi:DUF3037 domain-containing protein [Parapedobacter sp. ISTM3]|uniref:DUF3037 domain-containing protein n=1 Tax=Parapedobacter luteus TaxID=623280 RepID=A0A1T5APY1_9SPHI|nr:MULTISPECIES: DUF3037 domain-containing protein [Parapedobacter]MBK1441959.1 DUF3037 domain-containing protein [Parapedobacter sp. ISTM3]SKB37101.1 Protein of unknown function [Parapedobacter luteus]